MTPSTSLSLNAEIAIILLSQVGQYPPGNRNAEAFAEAAKIVRREETQAASLKRTSARLCAHDNTLSDIGKILGDESMSSAEIIRRVSALANIKGSHAEDGAAHAP